MFTQKLRVLVNFAVESSNHRLNCKVSSVVVHFVLTGGQLSDLARMICGVWYTSHLSFEVGKKLLELVHVALLSRPTNPESFGSTWLGNDVKVNL